VIKHIKYGKKKDRSLKNQLKDFVLKNLVTEPAILSSGPKYFV